MLKKIKIIFPFLLFFGAILFAAVPLVQSAGILPNATGDITVYTDATGKVIGSNCPSGNKEECGLYSVNDFMLLAINIARWILGIVGSLSLVMFIYGGFMFLISGGSSDSVTKAKKIILAAVIGLAIVFSSWLIIRFVLNTLNPNINWTGWEISVTKLK